MDKLPKSLDNRFNFYINILPTLDILGFWGSVTLGCICILYGILKTLLKLRNKLESKPEISQTQLQNQLELNSIRSENIRNTELLKMFPTSSGSDEEI